MTKAKTPRDKSSQETNPMQSDMESGMRPESDTSRSTPPPRRGSKDGGHAAQPSDKSDKAEQVRQAPQSVPARSPARHDDELGIDDDDKDDMTSPS